MPTLKEFLRSEVKPALGCTEPGAVALAVARACAELPDRGNVAAVRVTVSANIYKNGMAVGIPGAGGARGNAIAAALGAICGDASRGLEVLAGTKPEDVKKAEAWVEEKRATIYCDQDRGGVYVLASVFTPEHKAMCLIEGSIRTSSRSRRTERRRSRRSAPPALRRDSRTTASRRFSPTSSRWRTRWMARTRISSGRASR